MSGGKRHKPTSVARNTKGQFVMGNQEGGRPKGAKNKITLLKLSLEEAFREASDEDMEKVLKLVVKQALTGDKGSQKLIWDASMSKQAIVDDKAVGNKQRITVHTMNVSKGDIEGEYEVLDDPEPTSKETIQ